MVDYLEPISKSCTEKIINQMNNYFYLIKTEDDEKTYGFFCKIKYDNKVIPLLITNRQMKLDEIGNIVRVSINNKDEIIELGETKYKKKNIILLLLK